MGISQFPNLIHRLFVKHMGSMSAVHFIIILILSSSLLVKAIQFAFIVAITQSKGWTVDVLVYAVGRVFCNKGDERTWNVTSEDHVLGSFEADRGLRVFAFI